MATTNKRAPRSTVRTHEGAPAKRIDAEAELRRSVMACLLWEDTFYESGLEIGQRIIDLAGKVDAEKVAQIALEARTSMNIRHASLLLAVALAKKAKGPVVGKTIRGVIQRADELAEFLALYWKANKQKKTMTAQVKKGLAAAFGKFDEYQLAKYNRDNAVKLRDVLFLSHAKPKDAAQKDLWTRLANKQLTVPDTWETQLSGGGDKKETFTRLMAEKKLGGLALLRNLRNMQAAGVSDAAIREGLANMDTRRILPFRFVVAAKYAPTLEDSLEKALFRTTEKLPKIKVPTIVLVDISGSMDAPLSAKSEMTRIGAATALAAIIREMAENCKVFSFSDKMVAIPPRRGFALMEAIERSQNHRGTNLGAAVRATQDAYPEHLLICVSDEQSHDPVPAAKRSAYMVNVAAYQHGVGYGGNWIHVDGFSESIVRYIIANEALGAVEGVEDQEEG